MHSTVQTGLYTPNIFGYDYNYHNHPPPPNSGHHNHFPPAPHSFHVSKSSSHHNLSYQLAKHPPLSSAPPPSHHHPAPHHHHHHHHHHQQQQNSHQAAQQHHQSTPSHQLQQHHAGCKRAAAGCNNKASAPAKSAQLAPAVFKSMLAISSKSSHEEEDLLLSSSHHGGHKMSSSGKMINSASSPKFNFKLFSSINNLNLDTTTKTRSVEKFATTATAKPSDANTATAATNSILTPEHKSASLCSCHKNFLVQKCDPDLNCELCRNRPSPSNSYQLKNSASNLSGILPQQQHQSSPKKSTSLNSLSPNTVDENGNLVSPLNYGGGGGGAVPNAIIKTGASIVGAGQRGSKSSSSGAQAVSSPYKKLKNGGSGRANATCHSPFGLKEFKQFWQCTKPCGLLTLAFGVILILSSVAGFLFSLDASLCAKAGTCGNALLSISTISALVIGVVLVLVGMTIFVYSSKDGKTSVIVTNTKHIDSINFDQLAANQAAFLLKQPNGHSNRGNVSSSSSYNQSLGAQNGGGGSHRNSIANSPSSLVPLKQQQSELILSNLKNAASESATAAAQKIRDENEYNANESIKVKVPTFKFNSATTSNVDASKTGATSAAGIRISVSNHDHIDESAINEKTHLNSEQPRS